MVTFLVEDLGVMDSSVAFLQDDQGNEKRYPLNEFYGTPSLERLVKQGTRMSQFYAMSVCSPSRISLLTGQKAARHGTITWINPTSDNRGKFGPPDGRRQGLKQGEVTLASVLREAWYCMIHIGKARLGAIGSDGEKPEKLGFEINVGGGSMGQPGSSYGLEDYGHNNDKRTVHAVPHFEKFRGTETDLAGRKIEKSRGEVSGGRKG